MRRISIACKKNLYTAHGIHWRGSLRHTQVEPMTILRTDREVLGLRLLAPLLNPKFRPAFPHSRPLTINLPPRTKLLLAPRPGRPSVLYTGRFMTREELVNLQLRRNWRRLHRRPARDWISELMPLLLNGAQRRHFLIRENIRLRRDIALIKCAGAIHRRLSKFFSAGNGSRHAS